MSFEPEKYLTDLKGKPYLEVKWRLLWFRTEHPEGTITTEVVELSDQRAVFRATASYPFDGAVTACGTGTGSETPKDFSDYIEKAETKAIGRALAALGYGTQFAADLDEMSGHHGPRIVDAPAERPMRVTDIPPHPQSTQAQAPTAAPRPTNGSAYPASPAQIKMIFGVAKGLNWTSAQVKGWVEDQYGKHVDDLSKHEASDVIEALQGMQVEA